MASITIQVLEGFERGKIFSELPTPVTIGREEDNTIQLNDERVSRFHVKIQEDAGNLILTDLESTNGTRINGHPVQMHVLRFGDHLAIGRSILLFGSPEEIASQHGPVSTDFEQREVSPDRGQAGFHTVQHSDDSHDRDFGPADDDFRELFPGGPPPIPGDLRIGQTAQLSDLLAYFHDELAQFVNAAQENRHDESSSMRVERDDWQRLLKLEMQLARYLREIADPQR
ncbi:MAG: FHA domain-containing protein [Planctomycetes bacterium]|nr:FHA domain-containing protein [Planctomycetota bacterium]